MKVFCFMAFYLLYNRYPNPETTVGCGIRRHFLGVMARGTIFCREVGKISLS